MVLKPKFLGFAAAILQSSMIHTVIGNYVVIDPTSCRDTFLMDPSQLYDLHTHLTLAATEAFEWISEAVGTMKSLIQLDQSTRRAGKLFSTTYSFEEQALMLGVDSIASRLFPRDSYPDVLKILETIAALRPVRDNSRSAPPNPPDYKSLTILCGSENVVELDEALGRSRSEPEKTKHAFLDKVANIKLFKQWMDDEENDFEICNSIDEDSEGDVEAMSMVAYPGNIPTFRLDPKNAFDVIYLCSADFTHWRERVKYRHHEVRPEERKVTHLDHKSWMYKINEQVLGPADPGAPFTTNGAMTFNRLATQMVFIHEYMHTTKWENQEQAPPTSRASVYAEDHVYDWHDCLHFAQDPEEKSKACTNADSLSLFIGLTHWIKHMHTIDQNQPVYKNAGDRNRMIFARTFDNDGQGHVLHYDPPDPARAKVYWIHAQKELKIKRQREFSSQQLPSRNVQGEVRIYGVFNYVRQQEDPGTRSRSSSPSRQDKPNWPFRERRMRVRKQTKGSGSRGVTRRSSLKKNSSKSKVSPS